jgi:hypothetical protein
MDLIKAIEPCYLASRAVLLEKRADSSFSTPAFLNAAPLSFGKFEKAATRGLVKQETIRAVIGSLRPAVAPDSKSHVAST